MEIKWTIEIALIEHGNAPKYGYSQMHKLVVYDVTELLADAGFERVREEADKLLKDR